MNDLFSDINGEQNIVDQFDDVENVCAIDIHPSDAQYLFKESSLEVDTEDLELFILSLQNSIARQIEYEYLSAISPHSYQANADIWDNFYLRIPDLGAVKDFQKEKDAMAMPLEYEIQSYSVPRPYFEDIKKEVAKEASKVIKTAKFWRLKSMRYDYVGENSFPRYLEAVKKWESDKKEFDIQQLKTKKEFDEIEQRKHEKEIKEIEAREHAYHQPTPAGTIKLLYKDFSELSIPYALSIAFAMSEKNVYVDILFPKRNEIILSEFHSVTRTQTEENLRYADIIIGCAFTVAAIAFNASSIVSNVIIVGHSWGIASGSSKGGDYNLFAISFNREVFSKDFSVSRFFSPLGRLDHYPHIINLSKRNIISPIKIKTSVEEKKIPYEDLVYSIVAIPPLNELLVEEKKSTIKLDDRFEEAAKMVVAMQRASTSDLQRRLGMGHAKAEYVMDQLEATGIVGSQDDGDKKRVLVSDLRELDGLLKSLKQ